MKYNDSSLSFCFILITSLKPLLGISRSSFESRLIKLNMVLVVELDNIVRTRIVIYSQVIYRVLERLCRNFLNVVRRLRMHENLTFKNCKEFVI